MHEDAQENLRAELGRYYEQEKQQIIRTFEGELDELKAAIKAGDLVECADALADLQYVLSGAVLEFGLHRRFKAIFDELDQTFAEMSGY